MADIIEDVHPTRMELLEVKGRIRLATRGHKLLKEKRDSLVMEFFKIIDKSKESRKELSTKLEKAYNDLILANAILSTENVESIASATPEGGEVFIEKNNIFGVEIPKIDIRGYEKKASYETSATSSKLDEAKKEFSEIFLELLNLVESEESMRRLGSEIKLTRRRVNALEYIMIPKLTNTKKYIQDRLEELERENFFRLKMIKKKARRSSPEEMKARNEN